jgi:hypothetical protein
LAEGDCREDWGMVGQEMTLNNKKILNLKAIKPDRAEKFPRLTISNEFTINWYDLNIENHKYILI